MVDPDLRDQYLADQADQMSARLAELEGDQKELKRLNPVLFSRKSDNWATPAPLLEYLDQNYRGPFFDPCPLAPNFDGLDIDWGDRCFVNPPYSKIKLWAKKAYDQFRAGRFVIFLCPARTDTKYFHQYLIRCQEIVFIEGRLNFNGGGPAPFPSIMCIFDPFRAGRAVPAVSVLDKMTLLEIQGQKEIGGDQPVQ